MKTLSQIFYNKPIEGGSVTGNFVEVIGEQVVEDGGKTYDQYIYNIVGYTPKNGKPFVALKSNIILLG